MPAGSSRFARSAAIRSAISDGDRLYAVHYEQARHRRAERGAAEREAQRPVFTAGGQKFTDDRWNAVHGRWKNETDGLCWPCLDAQCERAEVERVARRRAEEEAAVRAEAKVNRPRGIFRRR
ncbi:hypothetical protein AB5J72_00540 [Streptomyces sp. CG1]|uniref:hypothetical protein n=1 Tax=Streptomyces sp. CG1 TaxID=1287523 RepID=UPI0034E1A55A